MEQALAALQACFGSALVVTRGPGAQIGGPKWEAEGQLSVTLPEGAEEAFSFWQELTAAAQESPPPAAPDAAIAETPPRTP